MTENAVSFTGHQFDAATGLVYARARYYDPTLGRFLSQDPEWAVNPYVYALDAPLEFTDPTGRADAAEDPLLRSRFQALNNYFRPMANGNAEYAREFAMKIAKLGPQALRQALRGFYDAAFCAGL